MTTVRSQASLAVLLGVVGVLGVSSATALAGLPGDSAAGDDPRAVALLRDAAQAMRGTSYSGTRTVSSWGRTGATTVVVEVEHAPGQGTVLDVRGGGVSRGTAMFLAASRKHAGQADSLTADSLRLLTQTYDVRLGPSDSVAGRSSRIVEVRDAGRLVAQLWIDDRSALLLRREVFDPDGRLAGQSVFIDLSVGAREFIRHLPPVKPQSAAHGVDLTKRRQLERVGWDCPVHLGSLSLIGIRTLESSGALHLAYSDGLTRVSVFEQPGRLDPKAVRGYDRVSLGGGVAYVRERLPSYVVWERDGMVMTAVTDGTVDQIAPLVGAGPGSAGKDRGFWTRLGVGMARIGSWASPLVPAE
ncbi:MAG: hypothetical protein GEU93_01435 [Propionibacteriales bacterium]|nr:hypothetical protein [Propionibacteriales bacterium]